MNWFWNTVDAIWLQKEQGLTKNIQVPVKKVHLVHHLLHLSYGSAVLGLSVLVHVMISNHLQKTAKVVHWQSGTTETNFIIHPVKPSGTACELGVAEDGTVVWRVKQ